MKSDNKVYFAEELLMHKIVIMYEASKQVSHMVKYETIISSTVI